VLFPYLHTILHFSLLHRRESRHALAAEIGRLLETILASFAVPVTVAADAPIATVVAAIVAQLSATSPSALAAWSREALQWGACCGDLQLAALSCDVFAAVLSAASPSDATPLMLAVQAVLAAAGDDPPPDVWTYVRAALLALAAIANVAAASGAASVLLYLFDFAAHFVAAPSISTATAALRVMSVFIATGAVSSPEQIMPHLTGISALLPAGFNDGAVCRFLTALVVNLPPASAGSLKALSLALLLPALYACASAYHSVEPFSTFVADGLVLDVFDSADLIGQVEFAGDARYAEIIVKYFADNAAYLTAHPPGSLIDELIAELWQSDPTALEPLGRFYREMCSKGVTAINSAIFAVTDALLRASPEKRETAALFVDVVVCAAGSPTSFAKSLLTAFTTLSGGIFGGQGALTGTQDVKTTPVATLAAAVNADVRSAQRAFVPQGDVAVAEIGCRLPIVPLLGETPKIPEDRKKLLANLRLQPFVRQNEFWQAIQKAKVVTVTVEPRKLTAFELFAHSEARGETQRTVIELTSNFVFPPNSFILRDEELGDFEARLA
jgi:hypothetical protein